MHPVIIEDPKEHLPDTPKNKHNQKITNFASLKVG
jgi:hypothetical protein